MNSNTLVILLVGVAVSVMAQSPYAPGGFIYPRVHTRFLPNNNNNNNPNQATSTAAPQTQASQTQAPNFGAEFPVVRLPESPQTTGNGDQSFVKRPQQGQFPVFSNGIRPWYYRPIGRREPCSNCFV